MKKTIITIYALTIIGFIAFSQVKTNPPKDLNVTLNIQEWDLVLQVIDESKDHQKVKAAQSLLLPQLQKQLADTTIKKK